MIRASSIGPLLLCLAVVARAQTGGDWIKYNSVEGRYSVSIPGEPKIDQQGATDPDGNKYIQHKASSFEGACLFLIGYYDYEKPTRFSFEKARDGIIRSVKGTLISDDAISLDGSHGRQLKFSAARDGVTYLIRARLYNVGTRVYVVQCIYPKDDDGPKIDAKAAKFFDSFAIRPTR